MEQAQRKLENLKGTDYVIVLDDDPIIAAIIEDIIGMKCVSYLNMFNLISDVKFLRPKAAFIDIYIAEHQNGLAILDKLRQEWPTCALFVMTGSTDRNEITEALRLGADDFLTKPLDSTEMKARFLAKTQKSTPTPIQATPNNFAEGFEIDYNKKQIRNRDQVTLDLNLKNFDIVVFLLKNLNKVIGRDELKSTIWHEKSVTDNAMNRKMYEVRKILEKHQIGLNIRTHYGVGFQMIQQSMNMEKKAG